MFDWAEEMTKYEMEQSIVKHVKMWGIEGTEDKIKNAYEAMPNLRDKMLRTLYNLYGFCNEGGFR